MISDQARSIMESLLRADSAERLRVPDRTWMELVQVLSDVPEKPAAYRPQPVAAESRQIAVLASGGLDSTAAYWMAVEAASADDSPPRALYMDMGQPYRDAELAALERLEIPIERIPVAPLDLASAWGHIHPGRNFLYFALALEHVRQHTELWFGAVKGEIPETGGDKSRAFLRLASEIISSSSPWSLRLHLPVQELTKTQIAAWLIDRKGVDYAKRVYSCFSGSERSCGTCQACWRRYHAFFANGLNLRHEFAAHPLLAQTRRDRSSSASPPAERSRSRPS